MPYKYIAEYDIGEQIILDEGTKLLGTVKSVTFGTDRQPAYFVEFERAKQGQPGTIIVESGHVGEAKLRRAGQIEGGTVEQIEAELAHVNPPMVEKAAPASFLAELGEVSGPIDVKP